MTTKEVGKRLNVTQGYVCNLCQGGFIKAKKEGKSYEINETSLEQFVLKRDFDGHGRVRRVLKNRQIFNKLRLPVYRMELSYYI